jgi:preprotein translocase subunit SecB
MRKIPSVVHDEPPLEIEQAALQLDGYYVRELHCALRDGLDEEAHLTVGTGLHVQQSRIMVCSTLSTHLEVDIAQSTKDQSKFRLTLLIASKEENEESPYIFNIKLVGYFSLAGIEPFIGMDVWVYQNAVMLLYTTAREIIASTTGRGPFPALILPTLTFDVKDSVRAAIREKAEAELRRLEAKKKPRQLPPGTKKTSKKGSSKSPSKKK